MPNAYVCEPSRAASPAGLLPQRALPSRPLPPRTLDTAARAALRPGVSPPGGAAAQALVTFYSEDYLVRLGCTFCCGRGRGGRGGVSCHLGREGAPAEREVVRGGRGVTPLRPRPSARPFPACPFSTPLDRRWRAGAGHLRNRSRRLRPGSETPASQPPPTPGRARRGHRADAREARAHDPVERAVPEGLLPASPAALRASGGGGGAEPGPRTRGQPWRASLRRAGAPSAARGALRRLGVCVIRESGCRSSD